MLLVNFSQVSKDYGGNAIFDQLNLEIMTADRIGLVGENGCGKSTLLRLLAGLDTPTEGTISRKRHLTFGYLSQEIDPRQTTMSIIDVVTEISVAFSTLVIQIHDLESRMADPALADHPSTMTTLLEAYGRAQERFEAMDGYQVEHKAHIALTGLGFTPQEYTQQVGSLSGGEKKLVNLARILVQMPDLLLLDEPDNHLDMAAKEWLAHYIQEYPGTVLLISHDRHLLDRTATKIFLLEDGAIETFAGNYSYYAKERQQQLMQRYENYLTQKEEIKRLESSLHQLREWARLNDKFSGRMHNMEKRIDRMQEQLAQRPILQRNKMQLHLDTERSGKKVLEAQDLSIAVHGRMLIQPFDLTVLYGERIGIVGDNGSGKSTLLKTLLGILAADQGSVKLGASVIPGYYAQEQETLPLDSTPLDFVCHLKRMAESQAIAILHRLLFSYRDMHTTTRALSGGEKSRLQMARLMLTEANFLLLDEPTNNLDIPSVEVLENALQQFAGTILMVSHDRYFLDQLATRIIAIGPDQHIDSYLGNWSDYASQQEMRT